MTITKFVDLVTRIPDPLSLHFYDFFEICSAFLNSLIYTGIVANTPLNEKNKLQPGPSPAFSAAAARRWCSARQGLPGLQWGGAWEREDRGTPTLVAVWVEEGRKRARRR